MPDGVTVPRNGSRNGSRHGMNRTAGHVLGCAHRVPWTVAGPWSITFWGGGGEKEGIHVLVSDDRIEASRSKVAGMRRT